METLAKTILWEEKNLIGPEKNCLNNKKTEQESIMKNIKPDCEMKECRDIGKIKRNFNFIGNRFGKLVVIKQYKGKRTLVDYICDCGTVKIGAYLSNVKNQDACKHCHRRGIHRKELGESAFNNLFNSYKQNAKNREYEFLLTKNEFRILTKNQCFYCGKEPSQIARYRKYNGEYIYNGVDRMDNTKGYFLENSVSCCKFCNLTKNNTSFSEFIKWIRMVYKNTEKLDLSFNKKG